MFCLLSRLCGPQLLAYLLLAGEPVELQPNADHCQLTRSVYKENLCPDFVKKSFLCCCQGACRPVASILTHLSGNVLGQRSHFGSFCFLFFDLFGTATSDILGGRFYNVLASAFILDNKKQTNKPKNGTEGI